MTIRHLACAVTLGASLLITAIAVAAGGQLEVSLPSSTIKVDTAGRFTYPVGCDDAGPSCAGDLRLYTTSQAPQQGGALDVTAARVKATNLGVATFTVAAGKRVKVPLRLNAAGRRALARRHGKIYKVDLRIRQRDADGSFEAAADGSIDLRAAR
jgi:hypothetical protein